MKAKIIDALLIVGLILQISTSYLKAGMTKEGLIISAPDLSPHHICSDIEFKKTENVIFIGCQPLYLPTSLFTKAMKCFTILGNTLLKLKIQIMFSSFYIVRSMPSQSENQLRQLRSPNIRNSYFFKRRVRLTFSPIGTIFETASIIKL